MWARTQTGSFPILPLLNYVPLAGHPLLASTSLSVGWERGEVAKYGSPVIDTLTNNQATPLGLFPVAPLGSQLGLPPLV